MCVQLFPQMDVYLYSEFGFYIENNLFNIEYVSMLKEPIFNINLYISFPVIFNTFFCVWYSWHIFTKPQIVVTFDLLYKLNTSRKFNMTTKFQGSSFWLKFFKVGSNFIEQCYKNIYSIILNIVFNTLLQLKCFSTSTLASKKITLNLKWWKLFQS